MSNQFERTKMLIGEEGLQRLKIAHVCLFGLGGVGGYVLEALVRAGIGKIDIVDNDVYDETNLNRQILATQETIGKKKVNIAAERAKAINPACEVKTFDCFYLPETRGLFEYSEYDYIIDAIDTTTAKLDIIETATKCGVKVISCMGTGNRLDPGKLVVADISKTSHCGLAKVMRKELRKRGIHHVKCVYSTEPSLAPEEIAREEVGSEEEKTFEIDQKTENQKIEAATSEVETNFVIENQRNAEEGHFEIDEEGSKRVKQTPGSISFVPSVAGMLMAAEVVNDLLKDASK